MSERAYIHIDVKDTIDNAMKRGTKMGKAFAKALETNDNAPIELILEQLKRILYYNPLNKKFVVTNFSENLDDFIKFEKEVCKIDKVVTFRKQAEV